ncbi:MAG: YciI family protein [Gammaproteobacteria bacterium]|nr:YciI family protein [Gammaproteobacteria bacterium]
MLYLILGHDRPDSLAQRMAVRPEHLQRLQQLQEEGRLIIAGPTPAVDSIDPGDAGFSGSVVIAEFASLQQAQQWADEDPYTTSGVFHQVVVKPFKRVLP